MSAMFFRPVVSYPTRCVAPAFFARPAVAPTPSPSPSPFFHDVAPLFSFLDESLAQMDNHFRSTQRQFKRPFTPRFDVKESHGVYSVEGELPGFDAKDLNIEFLDDGHTLQIKGRTVREGATGAPAEAEAEAETQTQTETETKAVADAAAAAPTQTTEGTTSETSSLKSHQATVEDDVEEPANVSATADATPPQTVTETAKPTEEQPQQQVTQQPESRRLVTERYTGSFTRSFKFPSKVDQEAVKASLKDGILSITLPFARKPASRKIQIQ